MTQTEAREAFTAALAHRTALVATAEASTGRKASAAWRAVENASTAADFAQRAVEMAVRAENAGADEATIQTLTLATA